MIKSIAFSAYPITDMARSRQFYEDILGLKPAESFGETWQEYDLGEGTFALVVMAGEVPEPYKNTRGTTIAFEVENLDETLEVMQKNSVPVVYGPSEFPTCRMFVVNDPDHNVIAFHQISPERA